MEPEEVLALDDIWLSDPKFWNQPEAVIDGAFKTLRRDAPISFQEEVAQPPLIEKGPGYWALTRYEDIARVTRDAETFCHGQGITIWDWPEHFQQAFSHMLVQDDPDHGRQRRIVSRAFTPKAMADIQPFIEREAAATVDAVIEKGETEFVSEIATLFPVRIICALLGIPSDYYDFIAHNTEICIRVADATFIAGSDDPDKTLAEIGAAGFALAGLMMEMAADRRANPRDDVLTMLVKGGDEEALSDIELCRFFILLSVAGAETTRNALAYGMEALSDRPDQKRSWAENFDAYSATAANEIIRWATPLIHFRRTATVDATIGDQRVAAGDKVVMFYRSGNRDEAVFDRPYEFDLARPALPAHLAFGAPGVHYCLGAHLARAEVTTMFREILTRMPDIEVVGPPLRSGGNMVHGIQELRCAFTPAAARLSSQPF